MDIRLWAAIGIVVTVAAPLPAMADYAYGTRERMELQNQLDQLRAQQQQQQQQYQMQQRIEMQGLQDQINRDLMLNSYVPYNPYSR